jgi:hypothetical protein
MGDEVSIGTYLPVLGLAGKHGRVLGLTDVASILVLDLLDVLLGADAVILGESTLVASLEIESVWVYECSIDGALILCGRGPGSKGRRARRCGERQQKACRWP